MRSRILLVVLLVLVSCSLVLSSNIPRAESESSTITVPDDFPTIQAAINNASSGDTIFVRTGTYSEWAVLNKSLLLQGEDRSTTNLMRLDVQANDTVIKGFSIEDLYLLSLNNTLVEEDSIRYIYAEFSQNSNITRNNFGEFFLRNCSEFLITENIVDFAKYTYSTYSPLKLESSSNNTFSKNAIVNGSMLFGEGTVYLARSTGNIFSENNFDNNSISIWFVHSDNNTFYHNNFTNNIFAFTFRIVSLGNTFDAGYPAGGNYYSETGSISPNYSYNDSFSGAGQNETGSDGLSDTSREWYDYIHDVFLGKDCYPLMKPYCGSSDIGVIVNASKTVLAEGYNTTVSLNVTVVNYGEQDESFNFTFNTPLTNYETPLSVESRNSTTYQFTLNATGFTLGNYTALASVSQVAEETDTFDNNRSTVIRVVIPGDVSSTTQGIPDGTVNVRDIQYMIILFNTRPSSPNWNSNADVNNDNMVNMRDIMIAILHFNQHE
jgi:parallel beta-helix repeat protein